MAPELEGSVDAHEESLGGSTPVGSVSEGVFADEDSRADFPFCVVMVRRDISFEKGEDILPMLGEASDKAFAVRVAVGGLQDLVKPLMEPKEAMDTDGLLEGLLFVQGKGVLEEPSDLVAEGEPLGRGVGFAHGLQFPEQVGEADLPGGDLEFVVGAPEVADEDSLEELFEEVGQGRGSPETDG